MGMGLAQGPIEPKQPMRKVAPIRCGTRKVAKSNACTSDERTRDTDPPDGTIGRNEMDTMVDTSCAESNWRLIEHTGLTCDVYPFKEGYDAVKDYQSLVEGDGGSDFILIGHEMLYFGCQMQWSLLNHYQIRAYIRHEGGRVQDDFTREDEAFGITTREMFIPFSLGGSAVYFESRVPSQREIETLTHIVLTSKER